MAFDLLTITIVGFILEVLCVKFGSTVFYGTPFICISFLMVFIAVVRWNLYGLIIVPILDASKQTVTYYDPYKRAINTMETYTGDYEISNKNLVGTFVDNNGITSIRKNEGFSVSFIAREKRQ